jgi:hypothetical protein
MGLQPRANASRGSSAANGHVRLVTKKVSNPELMRGSGRELLEQLALEDPERDRTAKNRGALPVASLKGRSDASKGLDGFRSRIGH